MNKGINIATGDVIGILNADDVYKNNQKTHWTSIQLSSEAHSWCPPG